MMNNRIGYNKEAIVNDMKQVVDPILHPPKSVCQYSKLDESTARWHLQSPGQS